MCVCVIHRYVLRSLCHTACMYMCFREMYVSVYNTSIILCVRMCVWKVTPPAHLLPTALIEASMSSQKGTTFVSAVWPGLFKWAAFPIDSDHIFCSRHMKAAVSGVLNMFLCRKSSLTLSKGDFQYKQYFNQLWDVLKYKKAIIFT